MTRDAPKSDRRTPPRSSGPERPPPRALARSRRIAWLLDDAIPLPGTRFRFGLDPILGLIPGGGDTVSWVVSLHLLWTGWRMRAGPATLLRMAGHLLVDAVLGVFPVVGDLFDFVYKANDRNLKILEALDADPDRTRRSSVFWLVGIGVASSAVLTAVVWGFWRLVSGAVGLLF